MPLGQGVLLGWQEQRGGICKAPGRGESWLIRSGVSCCTWWDCHAGRGYRFLDSPSTHTEPKGLRWGQGICLLTTSKNKTKRDPKSYHPVTSVDILKISVGNTYTWEGGKSYRNVQGETSSRAVSLWRSSWVQASREWGGLLLWGARQG